ncbi:hypothetical protein BT96DRAFT_944517 [Gymnopus androsaceus JB14]|uniref:Xylanolytic transcriptional activator regulatory domain-containing protein n=1 Tax=Gymnopus androsaceus JB14 TaxID=1447944 RepID=A0A6A4H5L8_9AGAR|nr:hypothetical protein BT96DRAFT_944517 [Gymnopus androsaceus JB14]
MPEDKGRGAPLAKRRASKACDECHRKKGDSDAMPDGVCSNCLASKVECKHLLQNQKRGPKAGSKQKQPPDAKTLVYKILAAPLSFPIPEDFQAIRNMLVDISNSTTLESNQGSNDAEEDESADVVDALPSRIEDIGVGSFCRQNATHASQTLLRTALNIGDELNGSESRVMSSQQQRTEFWTRSPWHKVYEPEDPEYVFPEGDLMQQLVSLFFSNINILFPLLNGPIFKQQVFEEKLHRSNPMFAATLLAVCSLGSQHCRDPRTLHDGSQSERSAGWKYFQQIRLVRNKLIQPVSLFEIQLYVLSSLFLKPTPLSDMSSSLIGMGIMFAREVGAHRKQPPGKTHQERVEQELWKRAYWVLVALDGFKIGVTGRPRVTTEDDYDLDLPIECDDEYWIESDIGLSFMQPPGQASYVAYWNHFLRLQQIAGRTRIYIPSIQRPELSGLAESSPELLEKLFMTTSVATNEWIDSMPGHLRWDPHNPNTVFFRQSAMLQTWLLFFQMRFHARWVRPGPVSSLSFSSLAICTNSARNFIHILLVYHQRPDFIMIPRMIPVAFLSAVLLLTNIWKQTWMNSALDPGNDLAQVHACMNVMSLYEKRFENPGRLRDVLQSIMSVGRIPSLSRQNLLKRTRDDELQESSPSDNRNSAPFAMPSELSFEIPPITSPSIRPFKGPYMGLSSGDKVGNAGLSDYEYVTTFSANISLTSGNSQEDWDSFMTLVDDLLSQTNQDRIF